MCEELEEILEYIQEGSKRDGGISQFTLDRVADKIASLALVAKNRDFRLGLESYLHKMPNSSGEYSL